MISARNITEKIICKCVSVHFVKYQFIDSENGNISYLKKRRRFGIRSNNRSSIECLFVRFERTADRVSISRLFEAHIKSYHFQCCLSTARAQLLNITPNCFPFDERSSEKVVRRQC
jgi:hypothetical protein